jgi:ArsR family transcriptional regulator, arsenate/arsenite/antimonite-responsive transcriptional repressor
MFDIDTVLREASIRPALDPALRCLPKAGSACRCCRWLVHYRQHMLQTARLPVDRLFRAFSDRTRLRILHLLLHGELCVCDLVSILRVPQPTASRHLSYLRRAGLVRVRQERSWKYYSLAEPRDSFHAKLLECLDTCFAEVPELGRDSARRAKSGVGTCCD